MQPFPNGVIFPDALNGRKEKDKIKTKKTERKKKSKQYIMFKQSERKMKESNTDRETKRREKSQTIHYVQIDREKNERK